MSRRVNPPAHQWQSNGHASRPSSGLAQTLRERIRRGEIPDSIQDIIGPIDEKDIDTAIEILRTLKGEGTTFEDLSPEEKRAFARAYLNRTQKRRSRFGGGAFVLGALAIVGGIVWWQTTRGQEMQRPPPPPSGSGEGDDNDSNQ